MSHTTQDIIFIIAEIGINHNGSSSSARILIESAYQAGVNGVKFQYRNLDSAYASTAREIGDEILQTEIKRCYLKPEVLVELCLFAQSKRMTCGISFFNHNDMNDFGESISQFDFFKVPSAELMNEDLIATLLCTGKLIYLSTGCHEEVEVEKALGRLPESGWLPFHCISNYPTMRQNSRLGYISYLSSKWGREVGYSSHDDSWETCLLAMQLGATVIERHITLDKLDAGLDHSSSSTPDEFKRLVDFAKDFDLLLTGNGPRVTNQGEWLNRQNLGRSFYAKRSIRKGQKLVWTDLAYRSPNIGLGMSDIQQYIDLPIQNDILAGEVISQSIFSPPKVLPAECVAFAKAHRLSLPVRLHDYAQMQKMFPIGAFEFHLSYEELGRDLSVDNFDSSNDYSIHLPDYVNSTLLMDPFSADPEQRRLSLDVVERTVQFAEKLQQHNQKCVPIVGSFSIVHQNLQTFHQQHTELLMGYQDRGVTLSIQWLPPIAWYFGGSVRLNAMNSVLDVELLQKSQLPVCMDICHLIMCRNALGFSAHDIVNRLASNINHIHIADAAGIDGEGLAIGDGEPENIQLIKRMLDFDCIKVIEVWQGHLDKGAGFYNALVAMSQLTDDK